MKTFFTGKDLCAYVIIAGGGHKGVGLGDLSSCVSMDNVGSAYCQ